MSSWELVVPFDGGELVVAAPDVGIDDPASAVAPYCYQGIDGLLWLRAPAAAGPATELRQLDPWGWADGIDHMVTCAMMCDPTAGPPGGRGCVVGGVQIGEVGGAAGVQLLVSYEGHPGALLLLRAGQLIGPLVTALRSDTLVCWRVAVTGTGPGRRCYVYAGVDDYIPTMPVYSLPVDDLAGQDAGCRFTVGARNIADDGAAWVRIQRLAVL